MPDVIKVEISQSWIAEIISECGAFVAKIPRFLFVEKNIHKYHNVKAQYPQSEKFLWQTNFTIYIWHELV